MEGASGEQVRPAQQPKGWWNRNWKWFVPVGCLGIAIFVIAGLALVFGIIKSTYVYKEALSRANASTQISEAVGKPIKPGFMVSGSINVSGPSGNAEIAIPISGPQGSGTIYVVAQKSAGKWTFTTLEVEIEGREHRIDLLEANSEKPSLKLP